MKKMSAMVSILMMLSLVFSSVADARKMGGARMGRTYKTSPIPAKGPAKPNADRRAAGQSNASADKQYSQQSTQKGGQQRTGGLGVLGGALAGLAAGGLLASLFGGGAFNGMQGADFFVLIALALAAFFLLRHFRRRQVGKNNDVHEKERSSHTVSSLGQALMTKKTHVGAGGVVDAHFDDEIKESSPMSQHRSSGILAGADVPEHLPSAFDQQAFLRSAREHYVTLQKSWNSNDLSTMRDYMDSELLEQIVHERSKLSEEQHTEILFVDADIVRADYTARIAQISVRYSGRYKDEVEGVEEDINDIWHLERDITQNNAPWRIVGME